MAEKTVENIYKSSFLGYLYQAIRMVLILISLLLLFWLFKVNVLVGNTLAYHNDFSNNYPFISDLFPKGRAQLSEGVYEINLEPVYFDVYYSRDFKTAEVKLVYKNEGGQLIRLGVREPGEWNYNFKILEDENAKPRLVDGWREGKLIFDLDKVLVEKRKIRFIISSPNLETNQNKVLVKSLGVVLNKD